MRTSRIGSVGLPVFTLVSLAITGCGARVALEDGTGGTASTSTSTGLVTSTSTGSITPYTGTKTSYGTGTSYGTAISTQTSATGYATGVYTGSTTLTTATTGVYTGYTSTAVTTGVYTGYVTGSVIGTGVYTTSVVQTYTSIGTVTTTAIPGCTNIRVPVMTGSLAVVSGYVTVGVLKGYGFTWTSTTSPATCISPTCGTTGCTPAFPSTSLCASGFVAPDVTYNSAAGVGFNLNQTVVGGAPQAVAAPAYITVDASMPTGSAYTRLQLSGIDGLYYCVQAGNWAPGVPIPITAFNSSCWDGMGKTLMPGMQITALNLMVPSDATAFRQFAMCLTNVIFN